VTRAVGWLADMADRIIGWLYPVRAYRYVDIEDSQTCASGCPPAVDGAEAGGADVIASASSAAGQPTTSELLTKTVTELLKLSALAGYPYTSPPTSVAALAAELRDRAAQFAAHGD